MKKLLLIGLMVLSFVSCRKTSISDLDCPCTLIAKQEPTFGMNQANLGEVVVEDKNGKLHTFSFRDEGVASLKNQKVGYKFGGGVDVTEEETNHEKITIDTLN